MKKSDVREQTLEFPDGITYLYIFALDPILHISWSQLEPPKGAHGQIRASKGHIVTNNVIEK